MVMSHGRRWPTRSDDPIPSVRFRPSESQDRTLWGHGLIREISRTVLIVKEVDNILRLAVRVRLKARDSGNGALGDSGSRIPDSAALAPGAAGAGGRFGGSGVVIIRGTQDFENYVASAVNGAVSRGVNVTATSAQRGAPVGH